MLAAATMTMRFGVTVALLIVPRITGEWRASTAGRVDTASRRRSCSTGICVAIITWPRGRPRDGSSTTPSVGSSSGEADFETKGSGENQAGHDPVGLPAGKQGGGVAGRRVAAAGVRDRDTEITEAGSRAGALEGGGL